MLTIVRTCSRCLKNDSNAFNTSVEAGTWLDLIDTYPADVQTLCTSCRTGFQTLLAKIAEDKADRIAKYLTPKVIGG
jgi:hypothetical protein